MIAYKEEKAAINNGIGWREPPIPLFMAAFRRKHKFTLTLFIKLLFLLLFCVFMNKQSRADPLIDVCTGKKEGHKFYDRSTNYVMYVRAAGLKSMLIRLLRLAMRIKNVSGLFS